MEECSECGTQLSELALENGWELCYECYQETI